MLSAAPAAAQAVTGPDPVRRFEFREGTSNKFWEVKVRGAEVTVRYGRIGAQGQTQVKSFADDAAAAKHVEKLIQEKVGKGYVEVR